MKNKTVLITGAAKNIGKAIAKELHNKGMDIIIHYNKSEREALNLAKTLNIFPRHYLGRHSWQDIQPQASDLAYM